MDKNAALALAGAAGAYWFLYQYLKTPPAIENVTGATGSGGQLVVANGSGPRGIRNNNPLNIKYNPSNNWKGQIGKDSGGFVVFSGGEWGIRAGYKLMLVYHSKYGLSTINSISRRWSPDVNGLSGAYANAVAKYSGVSASRVLNFSDDVEMAKVIAGFIAVENGAGYYSYYPQALIRNAIITK